VDVHGHPQNGIANSRQWNRKEVTTRATASYLYWTSSRICKSSTTSTLALDRRLLHKVQYRCHSTQPICSTRWNRKPISGLCIYYHCAANSCSFPCQYQFIVLCDRGMCVCDNLPKLPKVVIWKRNGWASNLQPASHETSTLTTAPPGHMWYHKHDKARRTAYRCTITNTTPQLLVHTKC